MTTGVERLVARLHEEATGTGLGPERAAAILATALADEPDLLAARLPRRDPGADWTLSVLHRVPDRRWSMVAAVFAPGVTAPIHDHGAWAVIGILRGRERETRFRPRRDGGLQVDRVLINPPGTVTVVPAAAVHTVQALDGQDAVSIHIYGTDIVIQPRHRYDPGTGAATPFAPPFAEPARP